MMSAGSNSSCRDPDAPFTGEVHLDVLVHKTDDPDDLWTSASQKEQGLWVNPVSCSLPLSGAIFGYKRNVQGEKTRNPHDANSAKRAGDIDKMKICLYSNRASGGHVEVEWGEELFGSGRGANNQGLWKLAEAITSLSR
jgi:hypothetical protein